MSGEMELDGLYAASTNLPSGKLHREPTTWEGSLDAALSTYLSLRDSMAAGDGGVFMIDTASMASARAFLEEHYTEEELRDILRGHEVRMSDKGF